MSHTRPDGISHAQWWHMQEAERDLSACGGSPQAENNRYTAALAHGVMALVALLTDRLTPREPTPADLPPIPPEQLAQYRMTTPDGEQTDWRPVRDGMYVQSAGGYQYEFRITRPGDPS